MKRIFQSFLWTAAVCLTQVTSADALFERSEPNRYGCYWEKGTPSCYGTYKTKHPSGGFIPGIRYENPSSIPSFTQLDDLAVSQGVMCGLEKNTLSCWGRNLIQSPKLSTTDFTLVDSNDDKVPRYCLHFPIEKALRCYDPDGKAVFERTNIEGFRRIQVHLTPTNFYAYFLLDSKGLQIFDEQGKSYPVPDFAKPVDFALVTPRYGDTARLCLTDGATAQCYKPDYWGFKKPYEYLVDADMDKSIYRRSGIARYYTTSFHSFSRSPLCNLDRSQNLVCDNFDQPPLSYSLAVPQIGKMTQLHLLGINSGSFVNDRGEVGLFVYRQDKSALDVRTLPDPYKDWTHPQIVPFASTPCFRWDQGAQCFFRDFTTEEWKPVEWSEPTKSLIPRLRAKIYLPVRSSDVSMGSTECYLLRDGTLSCQGTRYTVNSIPEPVYAVEASATELFVLSSSGLTRWEAASERGGDSYRFPQGVGAKFLALRRPYPERKEITDTWYSDGKTLMGNRSTGGPDWTVTTPQDFSAAKRLYFDGLLACFDLSTTEWCYHTSTKSWSQRVPKPTAWAAMPKKSSEGYFFPPYAQGLSAESLVSTLLLAFSEAPSADRTFVRAIRGLVDLPQGEKLAAWVALRYFDRMKDYDWQPQIKGLSAGLLTLLESQGIKVVEDIKPDLALAKASLALFPAAFTDKQDYLKTAVRLEWLNEWKPKLDATASAKSLEEFKQSLDAYREGLKGFLNKLDSHFFFQTRTQALLSLL